MSDLPQAARGSRDWLNALTYSVQSPPIVVRDTVITPASISSYNSTKEQIAGWTRAWDARTGKLKWRFRTIPWPGEVGNDTWENRSWEHTGKVSGWSIFSADEELGYVYLPLNTAAPDYYGGHRLGDNLFAESLLCLDVETGKRIWHYQFVHHGLWDYDLPAAPNLLDITVDGRRREGGRAGHEAGVRLHVRSRDRQAALADRRAAGATVGRSRRADVAHAAVSHQARPVRVSGRECRRPRGLHTRDSRDGGEGDPRLPDRAVVHAAVRVRQGRQPGDARAAECRGRRKLVRRRGGSGDRHALRAVAKRLFDVPAAGARAGSEKQPALHGSAGAMRLR